MSRKAIAVTVAVFFTVALAFGGILELTNPSASNETAAGVALQALETAIFTCVASGILPLGYWAFTRFRTDRIEKVLLACAMLGIAYMVLFGVGTFWHRTMTISPPLQSATGLKDDVHARFVKSIDAGCVANQERSAAEKHSDITAGQIITYCQCFAAAIAKEMTDADIMDIAKSGKLPASFEEKADRITPTCTRLALGH
jgi:hypothetical protein